MGPSHPFLKLVADIFSECQKDDQLLFLSLDQYFSELCPPVLSQVKKNHLWLYCVLFLYMVDEWKDWHFYVVLK